MPLRIALVGPGRLGSALARRWHEAGLVITGFVGRDPGRTARALEFVGAGRALELSELRAAPVVVLAVSDGAIRSVAEALARAGAIRRCALVFHLSGSCGREVLASLDALGARTAAMHPLVPAPDASAAYEGLAGRFALLDGTPRGERLLALLARRAGLVPMRATGPIDRAAYHAACALAANGATALVAAAAEILQQALGVACDEASALAGDLAASAANLSARRGAAAALSGPVVRGDDALVARHLASLERQPGGSASSTSDLYRVLMRRAVDLALARGLPADAAARMLAALAKNSDV